MGFFPPNILNQGTSCSSSSSSRKSSGTWGCASLKGFLGPSCPGHGRGERCPVCVCVRWRGEGMNSSTGSCSPVDGDTS